MPPTITDTTRAVTADDDHNFRAGTQAHIVADSVAPSGVRLTTLDVVLRRYVLSEQNTHRTMSRNSSSSRAIPVGKQVDRVVNHPAMPAEWGLNRPGMQADEVLDDELAAAASQVWLEARDAAVQAAQHLASLGVHKQVTNRLLEPFQWQRALVTATDWFGFFAQRRHRDAQPEIRAAADAMFDAMAASTPAEVGYGDWHLPLVDTGELAELGQDVARKVSAARCARVSYMTHDGRRDVGKDLELFARLADADPPHLSPLEHVATPVDPDRANWLQVPGNFQGWRQFRHELYPDW